MTAGNFLDLNVTLLPDARVTALAVKSSKTLREFGRFVLDGEMLFPHVSVYMLRIPDSELTNVLERVEDLAYLAKLAELGAQSYTQTRNGYIEVCYFKSEQVSVLQSEIIRSLNRLRYGLIRDKDREKLEQMSSLQKSNVEKFGFKSVGKAYSPHLTLTKLKDTESVISFSQLPDPFKFTLYTPQLAVFKLGEYGTCTELIHAY